MGIEGHDAQQGEQLRGWVDNHVLPGFEARFLPVDAAAAPGPPAERDAPAAATAIVLRMTVVTGNAAGFEATDVWLANP